MPFRKKKRSNGNDPQIVNWIIIAIVMVAFLNNFSKDKTDTPIPSLQKTATELKEKTASGFAEYRKKILPGAILGLRVEDSNPGEGNAAICGQKIRLSYTTAHEDGTPIDDSAAKDKPLEFTIGDHSVMPALEQGVIGMKQGGTRKIFAPDYLSYGLKEYAREGVQKNERVTFEVTLLDATPAIPDMSDLPFRIATTQPGNGVELACGTPAKLHITVWNMQGEKIFAGKDAITVTPGAAKAMLGIELGILGIRTGEARTLIIPPQLQKTLNGKTPAPEFAIPDHQTLLVDIEAVP